MIVIGKSDPNIDYRCVVCTKSAEMPVMIGKPGPMIFICRDCWKELRHGEIENEH